MVKEAQKGVSGFYVTDEELRAMGLSELDIDALDRRPETQKFANFSRDREAVDHFLAQRSQGTSVALP